MTEAQLKKIRTAAKITTDIMWELRELLAPGITGVEIDILTGELCAKYDVRSSFFGVPGSKSKYPANLCLGINDEVLHVIPSAKQVLKTGDLVSVDFGIIHDGMYTDNCVTYGIGELSTENMKLIEVGKLAVLTAAQKVRPGMKTGDLGHTMYTIAKLGGYDVLKNYVGHGIGKRLHLPPEIPAYGLKGTGETLKIGQVICVEAQVVAGSDKIKIAENGWDITTKDGENSVMFEYMVEVTASGSKILTPTQDWELILTKN